MTVLLIATNSMIYIASLNLFADLFYYIIGIIACKFLRKRQPDLASQIVEHVDPPAEEKAKMDKEFRIWSAVVTIAVIAAIALYIIPLLEV